MNLLALYEVPANAEILHSRFYVEGMIFGASASPEIPMPEEWLPWAIKHRGQMQNTEQADAITDVLFNYFKHCLSLMTNQQNNLPDYCVYDHENKQALAEWMTGLLAAHTEMEALWQNAWQKMQQQSPDTAPQLAKTLQRCLRMFSTFADPDLAISQAQERGEPELQSKLPLIAKSIPLAVQDYVSLSGELAGFLPNQFETFVQAAPPNSN